MNQTSETVEFEAASNAAGLAHPEAASHLPADLSSEPSSESNPEASDSPEVPPRRRIGRTLLWWMAAILIAIPIWPSRWGGPFTAVVVAGDSMLPTYQLGDVTLAWRTTPEVGDVIVYRIPPEYAGEGVLVIHRIIEHRDGFWITQGDNRRTPDHWLISERDILGVVWTSVPGGRTALAIVTNPLFLALLAGVVVALWLWPENPADESGEGSTEDSENDPDAGPEGVSPESEGSSEDGFASEAGPLNPLEGEDDVF